MNSAVMNIGCMDLFELVFSRHMLGVGLPDQMVSLFVTC